MQKWFVVNGPIGSGKTMLFRDIIKEACKKSVSVAGYFEPLLIDQNGVRQGYDIQLISKSIQYKQIPFMRQREKMSENGWYFKFDNQAISTTHKEICSMQIGSEPTILLFDEFGRLESRKKGLWNSLCTLITRYQEAKTPFYPVFTCRKQTYKALQNNLYDAFKWQKETECLNLPTDSIKSKEFIDTLIRIATKDENKYYLS